MNKQKMFDTVLNGVREQGGASIINGICAYRGSAGRRCAAGLFIKDEQYNDDMERRGIMALSLMGMEPFKSMNDEEFQFLQRMQEVHDEATAIGDFRSSNFDEEFLNEWEKRMKELARREGLIYTLPKS